MEPVRVHLDTRSYNIAFAGGVGGFPTFVKQAAPKAKLALVVADEHTHEHALDIRHTLESLNIRTGITVVPSGETTKSLAEFGKLLDALADLPADRQTLVVPVGGGVVGDLAGFAAASYNRGLPLIMVPTTLLAMVDSSVGGKTGINHPKGKNLIGAFHQPAGVWIDPKFLESLPDREYRSGLGEVVKYGVIQDAEFFAWQEANVKRILARDSNAVRHIVARSCQLKAVVVEQDEREETGLRAILNYGHTFAHAFETVGGYGNWLHGEAVAAGMVCASRLAEKLGRIDSETTARQVRLLTQLHRRDDRRHASR
jgi:3-dehydroquinate synthase